MTGRASKSSPSRAKSTRQMIANTMHAHYLVLRTKRKTRARTAEDFYGFREVDVVEMFFYKHGFGSGVWYRLKDGRVIDAFGKPSRRNRAWYIPAH